MFSGDVFPPFLSNRVAVSVLGLREALGSPGCPPREANRFRGARRLWEMSSLPEHPCDGQEGHGPPLHRGDRCCLGLTAGSRSGAPRGLNENRICPWRCSLGRHPGLCLTPILHSEFIPATRPQDRLSSCSPVALEMDGPNFGTSTGNDESLCLLTSCVHATWSSRCYGSPDAGHRRAVVLTPSRQTCFEVEDPKEAVVFCFLLFAEPTQWEMVTFHQRNCKLI